MIRARRRITAASTPRMAGRLLLLPLASLSVLVDALLDAFEVPGGGSVLSAGTIVLAVGATAASLLDAPGFLEPLVEVVGVVVEAVEVVVIVLVVVLVTVVVMIVVATVVVVATAYDMEKA